MSGLNLPSFIPSMNAARLLSVQSGRIASSLERLASGLRINRAGDDPGGLSISERLRSQWRGLERASLNAQDGISLMQTADSALTEITSTLQVIRELAVSAANGTKTANDRAAIQTEIEQYLNEIGRLGSQTEFNTKSLLTGELGALTSTSDYTKLRAAVMGGVGRGGSFVVHPRAVNSGVLERQVSDVLTVTGAAPLAGPVSGLSTQQGQLSLVTADSGGTGVTGVYRYQVPDTANGQTFAEGLLSAGVRARLSVTAASPASLAVGGVSFGELFQAENITAGDKLVFAYDQISVTSNVSLTISAGRDIGAFITQLDTALGANATVTGNDSGQIVISLATGAEVTGVQFVDADSSGSVFNISLNGTSGVIQTNTLYDAVSVTLRNNSAVWSGALTKTGANLGVITVGNAATGQVNLRFDPEANYAGTVGETDIFSFATAGGANAFEQYAHVSMAGAPVAAGTYLLSAVGSASFAIYDFNNARYTSLVGGGIDQDLARQMARGGRLHVSGAPAQNVFNVGQLVNGNNLDDGTGAEALTNVTLTVGGGMLKAGETAVFEVGLANTVRASSQTTLASINAFKTEGVFSGATSRTLDIYFSGRTGKATVQLNRTDTLADAAGKISLALWNPAGGGLLGENETASALAPPDLARVNVVGSSRGTISIASPVPGQELIFSGDSKLLNALDLTVTAAAQAPTYSVAVKHAESGAFVGSARSDTGYVDNVIQGVRLYYDETMNMRLDPEPGSANSNTQFPYNAPDETPGLSISSAAMSEDIFVHVAPNPFVLQVGAQTGQVFEAMIPEVSVETLGLSGLNVTTQERAGAAIGTVDAALGRAGVVQGRVGGYENALASTARSLDVAAENTLAAESRIRDLDYAVEVVNLARSQILAASASYALVQANLQASSVVKLLVA